MSRAGYSSDLVPWDLIRWRGQVASSIRGKRGQQLLTDLVAALDAMPKKALIEGDLVNADGDVCALGAVAALRGIPMAGVDPTEPEWVASLFNISEQLAREIAFQNDDGWRETPENRWFRMRHWASKNIKPSEVTND